ncbi:MAG: VacJ family lipoprotein, partial [Pseudomonadota bacterium]
TSTAQHQTRIQSARSRLAARWKLAARPRKRPGLAFTSLLLAGLLPVAACAASGEEPEPVATASVNDPIEPLNRAIFSFNLFLDDVLLEPAAKTYRFVVPGVARRSVRNAIDNVRSPVTFANDVLQGEVNRAGVTLTRFAINTTVGVGGLFDPAEGWGYEYHSEDFGQTLGTYGVGEGPYFVAPILGPAPPRDLVGRGVDMLFDPLTWVGGDTADYVQLGITVVDVIDFREQNLEIFDEIERTSLDLYATFRSAYRQRRNSQIANGEETGFETGDEVDFDSVP